MKNSVRSFITAAALLAVSCTGIDSDRPEPSGANEYNVILKTVAPGTVITKGGTAEDSARENNIQLLDLLFFRHSDGIYSSCVTSNSIINRNGSGCARMELPYAAGADNEYDVLAIANRSDNSFNYDTALTGKTLAQAKEELVFRISDVPYDALLMSGEMLAPVTLLSESDLLTFQMYRSAARIDVDATSPTAASTFKLRTAEIRNAAIDVCPFGGTDDTHVPTGVSVTDYVSISSDDRDDDPSYPGDVNMRHNIISQKLYAYENNTGSSWICDKSTCVIIGGIYTDPHGVNHSGYYRLDLCVNDAGVNRYHVRRNTRYVINISEVTGPGRATKEEAYRDGSQNVKFDITTWNNSGMAGVAYDGHRIIALSAGELEAPAGSAGTVFTVDVKTENIGNGEWNIRQKSSGAWCSVGLPSYTDKGGSFNVEINEDLPSGMSDRSLEFEVYSGDISLPLTVIQSNHQSLGISTTPAVISIPRAGLPVFTGGRASQDARVMFEFTGLSDVNATYSLHPEGAASEWLTVKSEETAEADPENCPVRNINYFVLEAESLALEQDYRGGYIAVYLYHDGTVTNFRIPVYQFSSPEVISVKKACSIGYYGGSNAYLKVTANCDWYSDWGSAKVDHWISNVANGLPYAEGRANVATNIQIKSDPDIFLSYLYYSNIRFFSKLTGKQLASTMVFGGYIDPAYDGGGSPQCLVTYVAGMFFPYGSIMRGNGWGRRANDNFCTLEAEAWNRGTSEHPIKGTADPCPTGWRIPSKGEYQHLFDTGYSNYEGASSGSMYVLTQGYFWCCDMDEANHNIYIAHQVNVAGTDKIDQAQSGIIEIPFTPGVVTKADAYSLPSGVNPEIRCVRSNE